MQATTNGTLAETEVRFGDGHACCVIMASGYGKRFGGNKLMADFHGEPMIARILDATAGIFSRRVVVTRHKAVAALCEKRGIHAVVHDLPYRNDTVRLGLEEIGEVDNCMFCPADQPLLRRETVASLVLAAANDPDSVWRTGFEGTFGSPVLFPKWTFPELLTLPQGKGGGVVIKKYPHIIFYIIAKQMFKKSPDNLRRVLQFGIVFANAGYMGIPVINDILGPEYTIYVTVYIIWFNVFGFSLGRLIYTDDKKYISVKEIFLNPAVIPIVIGLLIYVTGLGGTLLSCVGGNGFINQAVTIFYNVLTMLKNMVAPVSMMVIGARLADTSFKGLWRDKNVYIFSIMRLLLFPLIIFIILRALFAFNIIDKTVMTIVLVLASTPAAALTTMFAELYDGDSAYAGKLVALTTLLSVITMPLVSLLLYV